MKIDYTQEIRDLIAHNYDPVLLQSEESEYTLKKSLNDIYKELSGILPSLWFDESDVYEALQILGFKSFFCAGEDIKDFETDETLVKGENTILYFLDKKTANY